jgi:hypothetical protein
VDNTASKVLFESKISNVAGSPSLWAELLDQQLEAHFTKDVCSEFTESQALCIHLAASIDGHRYAKLYMAMLHNDTTWIDKSIRKEVQSSQGGSKGDLCEACKNVVQSSKTIYLQLLETVRNAFISTHEQSPAKKKCGQFFTKRLDTINVYLQSLKPDSFCSTVHLCASSSLTVLSPVNDGGECVTCVQRLQPRKDAATQAVNRLSVYFTELCAKSSIPQCQQMVAEVATAARLFIDEFDVQETCLAMGFCGQNAAHDIDDYEHAFVEEIGNQVCSTMGPFATLCQLVVQGDSKQVQIVSLNATNIDDFFRDCEEKVDGENTVVVASDQCSQDKNKCQCCIDRVIQKKKCLKKRVAKYIWHMIYLCKRCPVREKCERYYKEKKARWDAKIDNICPKKVCIRMGYCTKTDISSMCTYMGPFKQVCEQALNNIGQLFTEGHEQPSVVLTNHVSVQPKDEKEKQSVSNKP